MSNSVITTTNEVGTYQENLAYIRDEWLLDMRDYDEDTVGDFMVGVRIMESTGSTIRQATEEMMRELDIYPVYIGGGL